MTVREQGQVSGADASVGELVERLSAQVSALVRDEMALAIAEMKRKGAQAGVGIGIGGAGALVAVLGLGALVAAVLGLATVLAAWLAALLIGAALLVLAGVISGLGIARVRSSGPPVPEQALLSP